MKNNSFHLLFSSFIVGIIPGPQMRYINPPGIYYVSKSGSDDNPGTRRIHLKPLQKLME